MSESASPLPTAKSSPIVDYNAIVSQQRAYFATGSTKPLSARKERLLKLKKMIIESMDELCGAVYLDLHRITGQTKQMEFPYALQEIDYVLESLEKWMKPERVPKTMMNCLDVPVLVKEPLGVVLVISPWNYPISMVLWPLIPTLASGNTVIVKPSELAPNTAAAFAQIIPKYFEPEVCTVVTGGVWETTKLLEQRFDHIMYTGSPAVGKVIMTAAAKHLTPVTLELGGKSPAVVLEDAVMEISARRIAWGKWMNCGQTCIAPDYILVTSNVKDMFVATLKYTLEKFYGNDIKNCLDYSRIVNERHFDRLSKLLTESKGQVVFKGGELDRADLFFPPVVVEVNEDDALMKDEIFGPILPIVTVESLSEAIAFINEGEKPLAAYIFTTNDGNANRLIQETSSGGVCINDVLLHATVDTLPFGGVGNSGMGRYHGKYGFDTFTHEKAVLKRGFFGESLYATRYPPYMEPMQAQKQQQPPGRMEIPRMLNWIGRLPYLFFN